MDRLRARTARHQLVSAAKSGAAITTTIESFTLLFPSEITNEVAREAIRALTSLFLLPSIALVPGPTHAEWSAKLAAAKAKTGPFLVALRQGKEMVEQLLPNITVSVGHPKKYTTIQPAIAA